ncbi:type VI secretion system baseplate subunit TssF [Pseudomonas sp. NPDC007930]|uniref:type VI secretion system baseplate subunit TssF n=1 Tax=Pseudomonas sp. NPDC007930 TaxID=3364417 RepID=UPI0036ED7FFA
MNDDNPTLRYYEAEMRYLREAGKEFARAFPDRAALLSLDRPGASDPFVERLFEGFAFLMGRLREKLDDDLPEMTEGLVSLLWPGYLRPIPSLCMVEFSPDLKAMKNPESLPKGFEVVSQPVGPQRTCCRYTTTEDVVLRPWQVEALRHEFRADGRSVLRLRLACGENTDWSLFDLANVVFYLNGDAPQASALYHALTGRVQAVYLRLPGWAERAPLQACFAAHGFGGASRLWPQGEGAFSGYQLLLEYFTFREKFMRVALQGLEQVALPKGVAWLELDIELAEAWPADYPLEAENLRLHVTPVINLFTLEADPVQLDTLHSEHLLRPRRLQDGHTEIYSVDGVTALGSDNPAVYAPFSTFRHKGGLQRDEAPERYFHTRVKRGAGGLHDTWLVLGGEGLERDRVAGYERVSLALTGTQGQLPRRALQCTLLDRCAVPRPDLAVRNLSAPTQPCYPPNRDRFHWRVLSHLGATFLSMMDNPQVLRSTLALYEWTHSELNRRRIEAIVGVCHSLIHRWHKGCLLRGVAIEVTLDSGGFCGSGDLWLFGEMLRRFFALYGDVQLFQQLTLVLQPSGKTLQWNEHHSLHIPG